MSAVLPLEQQDPVMSFLQELRDLGPIAWAAIAFSSRERDNGGWEWDEAYEAAIERGGGWAAEVAAQAAAAAGSGKRAAAMAAGAAAALAARHSLGERSFEVLYRPVGEIVDGRNRRDSVYTTWMPLSHRPLPA